MKRRSPYQDLLLEKIEKELECDEVAQNEYLVSNITEDNCINVEVLLGLPDAIKLRANIDVLIYVLSSSLWWSQFLIEDPIPRLKLPYILDTKSLIIRTKNGLPTHKGIRNKLIQISNIKSLKVFRHKEGFQITFPSQTDMIVTWRALRYIRIDGVSVKATVSVISFKAKPAQLKRSMSMTWEKKQKKRKAKLPPLNITFKVDDFPSLGDMK